MSNTSIRSDDSRCWTCLELVGPSAWSRYVWSCQNGVDGSVEAEHSWLKEPTRLTDEPEIAYRMARQGAP